MRTPDQPLPGDLVIRCRDDRSHKRLVNAWVITYWPDGEQVIAGPYPSFDYALQQAQRFVRDRSEYIWRDRSRVSESEQLELVAGGVVPN